MHKKILGIFLAAVLLLPCAASAKESDTCPYRITVNLTDNIVTIYEKDSAGRYTTPDRAFVCSAGGDCQCRKIEERKYFYFTTLVITRKDVQEYMKHHSEYTKANRFKDIICKIYI